MSERLQIINDALLATGNAPLNVEYDGSVEWRAAESAFRRAVTFLITRHTWNFASVTAPLVMRLQARAHPAFPETFALPVDCLHVEAVYGSHGATITDYDLIDNKLCAKEASGLTLKYLRRPEPGQWPMGFLELVTLKVEAVLLRGLNEDTDNARRRDGDVEALLQEVRTMSDQQEPRRAVTRSRTAARRLARWGAR